MSLIGFYPVYDAEREEKSDAGAGTSYWSCEDEEYLSLSLDKNEVDRIMEAA